MLHELNASGKDAFWITVLNLPTQSSHRLFLAHTFVQEWLVLNIDSHYWGGGGGCGGKSLGGGGGGMLAGGGGGGGGAP